MSTRVEKLPRLRVKSLRVEEYDWRGLLAIITTLGYIVLLALRIPGVEMLGVAVGLIVGWYFNARRERKASLKLPRATEKHPDYQKIKAKIIETFCQAESYNPAYDDPIVGEMVKIIIDLRKVDKLIDKSKKLTELQRAVSIKARLLFMLEHTAEALAITRRTRIKLGEVKSFKDTMLDRLKEIMEETSEVPQRGD
jgi:hypothetical protein